MHPNEQYSHGCDSLVGVLFSCILHHVLYCTIYLSRTITRLKMYLVISCGIKYKKISLSLPAFCILCYAGRFIPPRFSSLHTRACIVHPTNEVTPYTDWALTGDQIVASHEINRVHGVGHGGIDIEQGNRILCLNQLLVEPVPLKLSSCLYAKNIFINVADGDSQCAYWKYYPKHSAVKIFFCLDIGIWHTSLEYACCIFLSFANCSLGTFQLDLTNSENST